MRAQALSSGKAGEDMPAQRKGTTSAVYQLKVTLRDSKPPIWRRIQVPGDITLHRLHQILQVAMGWHDSHLHQFIVGDTYYGEPDPDTNALGIFDMEVKSEGRARLMNVAPADGSRFVYEYDFGDSWEHLVVVEKILPPEAGVHYPRCLAGKRACPPEDCGGIWGYSELLEILHDPAHPDYAEMKEWIEPDFNSEVFSVEAINQTLSHLR